MVLVVTFLYHNNNGIKFELSVDGSLLCVLELCTPCYRIGSNETNEVVFNN
jgi:hypothetical protein